MSYELDLKNYHTFNRVQLVLAFLDPIVKKQIYHNSTEMPSLRLKKFFGKQNNPLSKYLRGELLICENEEFIPGLQSKRYFVNKKRYNELKNEFEVFNLFNRGVTKNTNTNTNTTIVCYSPLTLSELAHQNELVTGNFEYNKHSSTKRETHAIQYIPKADRDPLLSKYGYVWDYDIEAAAPTLILQHALKVGPDLSDDLYLPHYFPALVRLLNNKDEVRTEIAEAFNLTIIDEEGNKQLDIGSVKKLLHGILMGGAIRLSTKNHPNSLAQYLRNDKDKIDYFNDCDYIIQLKKDFKYLWSQIELYQGRRYSNRKSDGTKRVNPLKLRFSSKRKMACYIGLESAVRQVFMNYLSDRGIRRIQIHDGFQCDARVNVFELSDLIKQRTGYDVVLDERAIEFGKDIVSCLSYEKQ